MKTKFKVGDRVKNVSSSWDSTMCCNCDDYNIKGVVGKIIEVGFADSVGGAAYKVKWESGKYCGKNDSQLELVLEGKTNQSQTKEQSTMKYFKTKEILSRSITVCVAVDGDKVNTGYAVRRLDDVENVELGKRISLGRANNNKTNLTKGMLITTQLTEKYILSAIANKVLSDIENGTVVIKGIAHESIN